MDRYQRLVKRWGALLGVAACLDVGKPWECDRTTCENNVLQQCTDFRLTQVPCGEETPFCGVDACQVCDDKTDQGCAGTEPKCLAGHCVECVPGPGVEGTHCAGARSFALCNEFGQWGASQACPPDAPVCIDGRCQPCDPASSALTCNGNLSTACIGGRFESAECSGDTLYCTSRGCLACDPSLPAPKACWDANTIAGCDNGVLFGGTACPTNAPNCVNGDCVRCTETTLSAECFSDEIPRVCSAMGDWVAGDPCEGSTPACHENICKECNPDRASPGCSGDRIRNFCDSNGRRIEVECEPNRVCWDGACVACNPDRTPRRCPRACTRATEVCVAGNWEASAPCAGGSECVAGACAPLQVETIGEGPSSGVLELLDSRNLYLMPVVIACPAVLTEFVAQGSFGAVLEVEFAFYSGATPAALLNQSEPLTKTEVRRFEAAGLSGTPLEPGTYWVALRVLGTPNTSESVARTEGGEAAFVISFDPDERYPQTLRVEGPRYPTGLAIGVQLEHAF